MAATTLADDSVEAVAAARAENLRSIHANLTTPPGMDMGRGATWHDPYPEMQVTVHDTLVQQHLATGERLIERDLAKYDLPYSAMTEESA